MIRRHALWLFVVSALVPEGCALRSQDLDRPDVADVEDPAPASRPEETPASIPTSTLADNEEKLCLVGPFQRIYMQRLIDDNGYASLIEEQQLGGKQVAFAAQRAAWQSSQTNGAAPTTEVSIPDAPISQGLLFAKGREVTDVIPTFIYGSGGKGRKPTTYTIEPREHIYFVIEEAWDCSGQETFINEATFPFGEASERACLPEEIVQKCKALTPPSP